MNNLTVETIWNHTTYRECTQAKHIYDELKKLESALPFIIGTLYKTGIIEGKRQDRARRKGGVSA